MFPNQLQSTVQALGQVVTYSSGSNAPSSSPDGVSTVLMRVMELSKTAASTSFSMHTSLIGNSAGADGIAGKAPDRVGVVGALLEAEDFLRIAIENMEQCQRYINS